ncbi:hypothetical protein AB0X98_02645 [Rothia koreensis]|uniref:hypothetical protein n=1 Tax=Rothia koreensis TaxID=592378 RepID=UPI003F21F8DC
MVRNYQRKTQHPASDRRLRVPFTRLEQIDTEKIAEALIRVALSEAGTGSPVSQAGDQLRALLSSER